MTQMILSGKNIPWFTLWGAIGFGIGGAVGGAIFFQFEAPHVGFPILGAIGGASLGLALRTGKLAGFLALAGAIGFGVGLLLAFFIVLTIWEPVLIEGLFLGVVGGGIGGAALGIALRDRLAVGLLALGGAVGFGLAIQLVWELFRGPGIQGIIKLLIWGIIGGAFLGATLGYLERRKETR